MIQCDWQIALLLARDQARGHEAIASLEKEGLHPKFHQLDIDDPESVKCLCQFLVDTYGGLDILINNAGIAYSVWCHILCMLIFSIIAMYRTVIVILLQSLSFILVIQWMDNWYVLVCIFKTALFVSITASCLNQLNTEWLIPLQVCIFCCFSVSVQWLLMVCAAHR